MHSKHFISTFQKKNYCSFVTEMVTLLVNGHPWSGRGKIEIIKENCETKVCSQMPEYPLEVNAVAGSNWKDGKLSICGGYNASYQVSECYLMKNRKWKLSGKLQTARSAHGASNIGNSIWITGGYNRAKVYIFQKK